MCHTIPRQRLLAICGTVNAMIEIYRHGRSRSQGEELEKRVEAFLFFHERLGVEVGQCIECMRTIAPDLQERTRDCQSVLERVADCWKQLQSKGEVKDLEGQLEQLRVAADCLKNAVELTPANPLMEALEHGIPEMGMPLFAPPQTQPLLQPAMPAKAAGRKRRGRPSNPEVATRDREIISAWQQDRMKLPQERKYKNQADLAREFGVHRSHVTKLLRRVRYR